ARSPKLPRTVRRCARSPTSKRYCCRSDTASTSRCGSSTDAPRSAERAELCAVAGAGTDRLAGARVGRVAGLRRAGRFGARFTRSRARCLPHERAQRVGEPLEAELDVPDTHLAKALPAALDGAGSAETPDDD